MVAGLAIYLEMLLGCLKMQYPAGYHRNAASLNLQVKFGKTAEKHAIQYFISTQTVDTGFCEVLRPKCEG
jgi:hypothetical protein